MAELGLEPRTADSPTTVYCFFPTWVIYIFYKLLYVYVHLNIFYWRVSEDAFLDRV